MSKIFWRLSIFIERDLRKLVVAIFQQIPFFIFNCNWNRILCRSARLARTRKPTRRLEGATKRNGERWVNKRFAVGGGAGIQRGENGETCLTRWICVRGTSKALTGATCVDVFDDCETLLGKHLRFPVKFVHVRRTAAATLFHFHEQRFRVLSIARVPFPSKSSLKKILNVIPVGECKDPSQYIFILIDKRDWTISNILRDTDPHFWWSNTPQFNRRSSTTRYRFKEQITDIYHHTRVRVIAIRVARAFGSRV